MSLNNNNGNSYNNRSNNNVILNDKYINFKIFKKGEELNDQEKIFLKVHTYLNEGIIPKCIGMGLGGGFLGALIGIFFFTMQPTNIDYNLSYKEQLKDQFQIFKQSVKNSCLNFAKIGFLFSFYENSLQKIRATNDITNTLYSGCLTGATISYKKGLPSMISGCASFAAFSAVIEKLQRSKKF
ncbi:mitochondrial import inner membrane translocase subunit TIM22, putative (TIM22) [Plasmodium ovale wallikeri]|uniref:Mitochondrial import inner membrane translocase subunit TIM22 n=2 Tax=Plasmodium ovale TaxID=36330 RepID=A0A1A8Z3N0_PLAOA|nr:mitochondrial import inner membrane translocase subunit TIM22, putative (TIM22) [Plasmodium ovale wallikeri]SBT38414.1 mitochondrial import inner membrane translocase subunit TIM22, putative (TIM22) [Plasmodium ovale wallikeri]SBT77652.1 mitochondrial import inner membrane translocase subunit TIM22, putative [Plasmodium ovale]